MTPPNHKPPPPAVPDVPRVGRGEPTPADHIRMIVELLQPLGPDLARRWLAALLVVAREEREGIVAAVERQIVDAYSTPTHERTLTVTHGPVQRRGHVEHVDVVYEQEAGEEQPHVLESKPPQSSKKA